MKPQAATTLNRSEQQHHCRLDLRRLCLSGVVNGQLVAVYASRQNLTRWKLYTEENHLLGRPGLLFCHLCRDSLGSLVHSSRIEGIHIGQDRDFQGDGAMVDCNYRPSIVYHLSSSLLHPVVAFCMPVSHRHPRQAIDRISVSLFIGCDCTCDGGEECNTLRIRRQAG